MTEHTVTFVPRARGRVVAYQVQPVLRETPVVRDRIVRLGQRKHPCRHPVRLVEVWIGGTWQGACKKPRAGLDGPGQGDDLAPTLAKISGAEGGNSLSAGHGPVHTGTLGPLAD